MKSIIHLLAILLAFTSCSNSKNNHKGILDRDPINNSKRQIVNLNAIEIKFLEEYDFYANYEIIVDSTNIYLADTEKEKILQINKNNYEDYQYIGNGAGNGPGEVAQLQSFGVANDTIVIFDRNNSKLVYFDQNGEFLNEYKIPEMIKGPHRVSLSPDYTFLSSPNTEESIFFKLNSTGKVLTGFEKPAFDSNPPFINGVHSMLAYAGYLDSDSENNLFFSSYPESVIRKYNTNGELEFSVNTIESNRSDMLDYSEPNPNDRIIMSYAEDAHYSAGGLTITENIIAIIKYDNSDYSNSDIVDIYSSNNGKYIKSYKLEYSPTDIAIYDNLLYSVRYVDNKPAIVIYKIDL